MTQTLTLGQNVTGEIDHDNGVLVLRVPLPDQNVNISPKPERKEKGDGGRARDMVASTGGWLSIPGTAAQIMTMVTTPIGAVALPKTK